MMAKSKLEQLTKESFLTMVRNSPGTKMFRNSFFLVNGKKRDILENGRLSCAIFVSSILYIFKLVHGVHATVDGTINDLQKSGWHKVTRPLANDILIWESQKFKTGSEHKHIGFCTSPNEAISNNYKLGYPVKHHITFGIKNGHPARKLVAIYRRKLI